MVGGPNSFASGRWNDTSVSKMLPVELGAAGADWDESLTTVARGHRRARSTRSGTSHPTTHRTGRCSRHCRASGALTGSPGSSRQADVLARIAGPDAAGEPMPALAVQPYGRGRTMAMTTAITGRWASEFTQSWGGRDAPYYKKFWRNVVYWLTENSSIGRRRLLAETDKRLYRPGEPIILRAQTFDENAALTLDYRVAVTVEPRSASDSTADNSPLRRPPTGPSPPTEKGRCSPGARNSIWAANTSRKGLYERPCRSPLAKSLPAGATLTQGMRFELTAYENSTQVDSTTVEVQILDDPSEQQNPLPDHDLLRRIAEQSGGTVLKATKDLSAMIDRLPRVTGPPEVKKTPAWSVWPLLSL